MNGLFVSRLFTTHMFPDSLDILHLRRAVRIRINAAAAVAAATTTALLRALFVAAKFDGEDKAYHGNCKNRKYK